MCLATDPTCVAQCSCFDTFGGASCALSGAELTARDSTRAQLCESILSVGSSADVSTQLLDSLVSSLYVSYDPSEVVSAHAQEVCQSALSFVADLAAQGFLTSESTTSLMFQSLSKYVAPAVTASRRRLQDGLADFEPGPHAWRNSAILPFLFAAGRITAHFLARDILAGLRHDPMPARARLFDRFKRAVA